MKKIRNLSTEMTPEGLAREWASTLSSKHKLLRESDWTQLLDSGLSMSARLRFEYWRLLIRRVDRHTYQDIASANKRLKELKRLRPMETKAKRIISVSSIPLIDNKEKQFAASIMRKAEEFKRANYWKNTAANFNGDAVFNLIGCKTEESLVEKLAKFYDHYDGH